MTQNNSTVKNIRESEKRTRSRGRPTRPCPRSELRGWRGSVEYMENLIKRFKAEEEDFNNIFTIPQEKIFTKLKDQNIFQKWKSYGIPEHVKDNNLFYIF